MKELSVANYQTTQKESLKAQSLAEWTVSACMNSAVTILTKPDRITAEELIKARDMLDKAILAAVERDALAKVNYKIATMIVDMPDEQASEQAAEMPVVPECVEEAVKEPLKECKECE